MLFDKHIRELWQRMAAIYGHKWVSSFGETDSDGTWLRGLGDLSPEMIGRGLHACIKNRKDDWPPTLPEFRRLCLGLDEIETACYEALNNRGGALGEEIRKRIGSWNMRHDSSEKLMKKAKAVYPLACDEITKIVIENSLRITHESNNAKENRTEQLP